MATRYDPQNAAHSDAAHVVAQRILYPRLFGCSAERLVFETDTLLADGQRGEVLDGEMAIDYIVRVPSKYTRLPIPYTVQERFRRPHYSRYRDITLTEWNGATNLPSELYKLRANIFLYGYFDPSSKAFLEAVAVSVPHLQLALTRDLIRPSKRTNEKQQTFLTVTFDQLRDAHALIMHFPAAG